MAAAIPKDDRKGLIKTTIVNKKFHDLNDKQSVEIYTTPYAMFFSDSPTILPSHSETDICQLYMSCFNQIELSKLFPYIDIRFNVDDSVNNFLHLTKIVDPTRHISQDELESLIKPLNKKDREALALIKKRPTEEFANRLYHARTVEGVDKSGMNDVLGQKGFGMEVFTSPQTLVSDYATKEMGGGQGIGGLKDPFAVSYKHLTLPTIYSV